jgi:hypothetical protein
MGAGIIIGGIVLLMIGIIIFGFSMNIYNIQTNNIQECGSFSGQLGQTFDPNNSNICSTAGSYQSFAMTGMLLGGALALVGLMLTIVGAIQTGKKRNKDLSQKTASINASPPT